MSFRNCTLLGAILLYNRTNITDAKYWPYQCTGNILKCASPNKIYKKYSKVFKTDLGILNNSWNTAKHTQR